MNQMNPIESINSINFEIMSREQIINLSLIEKPNLNQINFKNYLFEIELENSEIQTEHEIFCSICMNELNSNNINVCKLSCNHLYHTECIEKWLGIKFSCPYCRKIPQTNLTTNQMEQLSNSTSISRIFASDPMQMDQIMMVTDRMLEQMGM